MKPTFWLMNTWKTATDSDWGEDDSSGKAVQPDHYPNINRPNRKERKRKHKTDAVCGTCKKNNLVNGACPQCDWGDQNTSHPIKEGPLDPFRDDKAGIRAGAFIPTEEGGPIDKSEFGPDDWYYEIERRYNPPRFWVIYPARNAGRLVTKSELDQLLASDAGQMKLPGSWEGF